MLGSIPTRVIFEYKKEDMNFQKSLLPANSSILVKELNTFLRINGLLYDSYCRVFEDDRVLMTICFGDKELGTIHFNTEKWWFNYFFDSGNWDTSERQKLLILIDAWIKLNLNRLIIT